MNTKELIKLANIADKEGDLELADFIDRELLAMSNDKNIREAVDYGKFTRPIGNALGKIPEFFGFGKYKAPANWTASGIDLMTQNPNRSGNAFQQMLGSVDKEINLDANQVKNLETQLLQQLNSSMDQADPATQEVIKKIINKDFKNISSDEQALLGEFARKTGIVGRRTDADFGDLGDLVRGNPLKVRPRTVQRVNPKAKLIGGGLGALALAPSIYNTFAGQGPDTTGSAIPSGPMGPMGMPQLDPMGGFGGGYNGPQVGGPNTGGYEPTRPTGLGYANSVMDPASNRESAGYAPTSQYTGRSVTEINPAAKYRSYEGMMIGEGAPAYNNQSYVAGYSQPAVTPVITPQVNAQPVAAPAVAPTQLDSIPPVVAPTAQELAGQPGFGGATDSAGIAAELYGDQTPEPQTPPLTPGQIQNAMNPLETSGY